MLIDYKDYINNYKTKGKNLGLLAGHGFHVDVECNAPGDDSNRSYQWQISYY